MKKKAIAILLLVCMITGCRVASAENTASGNVESEENTASEEENLSEEKSREEKAKVSEVDQEVEAENEDGENTETEAEGQADQDVAVQEESEKDDRAVQDEPKLEEFGQGNDTAEQENEQVPEIILTEERQGQIETCLSTGDFSYSPITLGEVTTYLDEKGILYEGSYTGGERADMTLEDGTTLLFLETENQDGLPFGYELLMVNEMFNQWSFQENYLHCYDVIDDQYYYPELSERVWKEEEFNGFNRTDLSIARNELFAKHGRIFGDPFLSKVFEVKSWYEPKYTAEEFDSRQSEFLTDIENENLQTIIAYEKMWGWRGDTSQGRKEVTQLLSGSWLDLNGDGVKEQIVYEKIKNGVDGAWDGVDELNLIVKSGTGESCISLGDSDGYLFHENCFVTTMNETTHYLIVLDYGPSADYISFLYEYENGELVLAGQMASYSTDLKVYEDRILAPTETYHLQCQPVDYVYILQDGKFVHQPSEYYDYRGNTVTALRDIPLFAEKEDAEPSIELKKGEQVKILGGDLKEWVLLEKVDTGEQGWLKENEEGFDSYGAFDGLYIYG